MKRLCLILLACLCAFTVFAIEKSPTVVVINGAKFYVHTVKAGETLYAISKCYGVGERVIVEHNPSAASGLKTEERLKIPFVTETSEQLPERKLRKSFDMHFVAQGETLYGISRRYSIPIQTLIDDNPGLDPIHLRLGERILIRRDERGTEPASEVEAQWETYKDNLNSVTENGQAYHIVQTGETFYSLSHRFGISEEQLSALNGGLRPNDLKAGAIIKIANSDTASVSTPEEQVPESVTPIAPAIEFKALDASATLRVALLLPMSVDGKPNANYLEFYQGFLLGLDSVKRQGYSVQLDLYNTSRSMDKVRQLAVSDEFRNTDLIVGPVYEDVLDPILQFAERKRIPVVSPLANITRANSETLFQLSPVPAHKYDKIADLIDGSKKLTLIYSGKTDKEFESEILGMLGDSEYSKYQFRYDVTNRGKAGSSNDLTPLLHNDKDNVLLIMAESEVDVDRILAALASANTNIMARGFSAPRFVILGNNHWNRYSNLDRTMFFKNRVVFLSTYHAKRDSQQVKDFDSSYIRAFGSLPTLYSYRGYDAAVVFCMGMFGDIQYDMEGESYTPLQTTYVFAPQGDNHVNRNWMRVNYNSDFTISIE